MKSLLHIKLFIVIFFITNLNAQLKNPFPSYSVFNSENKLPSSESYFVYKDSENNIWICTDRGLVKFDGFHFKIYTEKDGLKSNVIFKVVEDKYKNIWIISLQKELFYIDYNTKKVQEYKFNHLIKDFFINSYQTSKDIMFDDEGSLFYTVLYSGIIKINSNGKLEKITTNNNNVFHFKTKNKLISASIYDNLASSKQIDIDVYINNKKIKHLEWDKRQSYSCLHKNDVIYSINNKILCNNKELIELKKGSIILSIKIIDNELYVGTLLNGIYIFEDIENPKLKFHFLKNYSITSCEKDKNNIFWFSTIENGVFQINSIDILNFTEKNGLLNNYVYSIAGIKNKVLFGYRNSMWNTSFNNKHNSQNYSYNSTNLCTFQNNIYIANYNVIKYNFNDEIRSTNIPPWNKDIYNNRNQELLFTTTNVLSYSQQESKLIYIPLYDSSRSVQGRFDAICKTYDNIILAGNENGLHEIENNKISDRNLKNSIFKIRVTDIQSNSQWGNICSTRGKGVYHFKEYKIIKNYNKNNGLLSNDINILYLDSKNRLWIGSNKGINVILKPNDKYIYQITKKNGLISNEITSFYEYNDTLWVGTKKGLSKIDLTSYKFSKENKTKVTLNSLKINGKQKIDNNYSLKNSENNLEIYFKSNNFNNSLSPTFAFRINNGKWETIHQPQINFINLSYGNYNIEIKHLDENNNWTKPQPLIKFRIDLPYYLKWYSVIFYILLIGLLFYVIYKFQIKKIKQKEKTNKRIKALETKSLSAQMNPHFIFNALNSIQSFIIFGESDKAEHFLTKFAQLIRQTLNNSRTSFITIQNEIDTLKKYIEIEEMRFKNKFTHVFIFENLDQIDFSRFIPPLMIQPFVENSILHAFKSINHNGLITVKFQKVNHYKLLCIIEDNGVGIEKSLESKTKNHISLGSNITQERLDLYKNHHNNTYSINFDIPESKKGTVVYVEIPIFEHNEEY